MICPKCGLEMPLDWDHCAACLNPLHRHPADVSVELSGNRRVAIVRVGTHFLALNRAEAEACSEGLAKALIGMPTQT